MWRGSVGSAYLFPALSSADASIAEPCPVSTPRSSNRTCRLPASGSRTRSYLRPRKAARARDKAGEPICVPETLAILGEGVSGLSPANIVRLKADLGAGICGLVEARPERQALRLPLGGRHLLQRTPDQGSALCAGRGGRHRGRPQGVAGSRTESGKVSSAGSICCRT